MLLYLLLAIVSSVLLALGLLMMKSRASSLPDARGSGIVRGVLAWIGDPVWLGGLGVQTLGYALYVVAIAGAPVSMVAVMMQGGIGLFVLLSVVFLGERAWPREWAGIGAIIAGMVLLSLSLSAGEQQGAIDVAALLELTAILLVLGALPFTRRRLAEDGAAQAIGSGIAFGLGALFTKAMTDRFLEAGSAGLALRIATDPWVYATIAANIAGIVMLQNSFHQARAIIAMPLSSALSNLVPIAGGMLAFGEGLPSNPGAAAMRIAAFALTVVASMMLAATEEKAAARNAEVGDGKDFPAEA
jgi:multidrug transporter EmrE-like cation transporter